MSQHLKFLARHTNELLHQLFSNAFPADKVVGNFFHQRKYLGSHDRAAISDCVYGIIRNLKMLESFLASVVEREIYTTHEQRFIAYYILYQALFTSTSREKLITEFADVWNSFSPQKPLGEFLDTVSLDFLNEHSDVSVTEMLGMEYSFPPWLVEKFFLQYGNEQIRQLLYSLNTQAPITIRINTIKCSREECKQKLLEEGIQTTETKYSPYGLTFTKRLNIFEISLFKKGWFEIQDEGSQLISALVNAQPHELIIDACSGAGGKSLAMVMGMRNNGRVLAVDISKTKIARLKKRRLRAGATILKFSTVEQLKRKPQISSADAVLVDVPCSGTGRIRRDPFLKTLLNEEMIRTYCGEQQNLLNFYSSYVKSGGRLIYSTCSLLKEENENIVENFLRLNKNFQSVSVSTWSEKFLKPLTEGKKYFQCLPHLHGTDGFFGAVLKKVEE
ncbi:MAG: RsmB/NOP family class I SAM-dependent RNA methyltransferase [Ignavibacteria bacterium]|nr:RsmB/NOP family class I SAM-dependent RNA methyltransferase [Ignavibacteria bacterium]